MTSRYTYQFYEMAHMAMAPARMISEAIRLVLSNPSNPWTNTLFGRNMAASAEVFERLTRRYGKPAFGLRSTSVNGQKVAVTEEVVWSRPFCNVVRFKRDLPAMRSPQPKFLIVAPMSGHYATLLRGTVAAFLPDFDVYVTDWTDARQVPLTAGRFDLDDYIDYLISICHSLGAGRDGTGLHTLGVCQPSVPLLAAVARMSAAKDPFVPASMTLMGGPIDTRKSPTAVNTLAEERGIAWFEENCIQYVPFPYPGVGRRVYPGFLQLTGFMAMNINKHFDAHVEMFKNLVKGDGDRAEKHREFYDEYMAVIDLTAEFYLQTVDEVFVKHSLPDGRMTHRGKLVDLTAIDRTGLMTVEGELDDISGIGQTRAAQDLCVNVPAAHKTHYEQAGVGHYGVFNGSRFRSEIMPRIRDFIWSIEQDPLHATAPANALAPPTPIDVPAPDPLAA